MRSWLMGMSTALSIAVAGCGASPDAYEDTTPVASSALRPLEIARPEAQMRGIEGDQAVFDIRVIVTNPNDAEVVMRRAVGELLLGGNRVARLEIDGAEPLDADSERVFVFDVSVPAAMLAMVRSDQQYVARGTLYADGGSGDEGLQTPFELMGDVPPLQ